MTVDEKVKIEKEITGIFEKMTDITKALNYDAIVPYNAFNDDFSTLLDGTISIGGEKGKELFKSSFDYVEKYLDVTLLEEKAIALDRNTALFLLRFNETYVLTTGDTLEINGSGSYLFKKFNDDWKVVHISAMHNMVE